MQMEINDKLPVLKVNLPDYDKQTETKIEISKDYENPAQVATKESQGQGQKQKRKSRTEDLKKVHFTRINYRLILFRDEKAAQSARPTRNQMLKIRRPKNQSSQSRVRMIKIC